MIKSKEELELEESITNSIHKKHEPPIDATLVTAWFLIIVMMVFCVGVCIVYKI